MGKNYDRGLENAEAADNIFKPEVTFPYADRPLSRPITFLTFSSCRKLTYNFTIELAYVLQTIRKKSNERTSK